MHPIMINHVSTSIRKSPILRPALHATPPSSTDSRYCRAGKAGVGVNSSMGVWAGDAMKIWQVRIFRDLKIKIAEVDRVILYFLTFGPSQHESETLAVFFLQKHCLLLDYIVTSREETEKDRIRNNTKQKWKTEGECHAQYILESLRSPENEP